MTPVWLVNKYIEPFMTSNDIRFANIFQVDGYSLPVEIVPVQNVSCFNFVNVKIVNNQKLTKL